MPKKNKKSVKSIEKMLMQSMEKNKKKKGEDVRTPYRKPFCDKKSRWRMTIDWEKQERLGKHCGRKGCNKKTEKEVIRNFSSRFTRNFVDLLHEGKKVKKHGKR